MDEETNVTGEMREMRRVQFPQLEREQEGGRIEGNTFAEIPIQVTVELGRTDLTLKEITELKEGSIIELKRFVGEPLDVKVGNQIIAQGEVVTVDDHYGIRVTNVLVRN